MRRNMQAMAGYGRLWQDFISSGTANKSNRTGQKTCKAAECIRKNQSSPESCYSCQFVVAYNIAKHSKSFSDGEFVNKCILHVADQVCPQQRKKFEEVSLSRRTGVSHIEAIGEDLTSQLKRRLPSFQLFSLALDESTDIDDTAQLLIFVRGISENFEITEELLSMESMKDTTTGEDIFRCVENAMHTMQLPWQKMVSSTSLHM
ncbi:general transcription factor II-I repeat domain-containing protein 2-like [Pomacea canaliculata]|uniref:general transcription factor II-I repeat domain-containing protein 2-like n=1 Tax=Pomacea canaliculata TaxID=400727 RepID=UPI000D73E998|nr:general transcription factor II-I repeat domain-containing protein 2-like [Pomacea canaliculata]